MVLLLRDGGAARRRSRSKRPGERAPEGDHRYRQAHHDKNPAPAREVAKEIAGLPAARTDVRWARPLCSGKISLLRLIRSGRAAGPPFLVLFSVLELTHGLRPCGRVAKGMPPDGKRKRGTDDLSRIGAEVGRGKDAEVRHPPPLQHQQAPSHSSRWHLDPLRRLLPPDQPQRLRF